MDKVRRPCASLWRSPFISWNGDVTVCCVDDHFSLGLGNCREKNLYDIWNSDRINSLRLAHVKGDFTKIPLCSNCQQWDMASLTDSEVIDYLKSIGRYDQILPYLNRVGNPPRFHGIDFSNAWAHVEISDKCNLRCIMCEQSGEVPWHNDSATIHGSEKGFMSLGTWNSFLDSFKGNGIHFREINPFWWGESLLHPDFMKLMQSLASHNKRYNTFDVFQLHTNANLLDLEKSLCILDTISAFSFGKVFFSIDAATKETYDSIRRGGSFEGVENNIKRFIGLKKSRGLTLPRIILQFIVMDKNSHEVLPFYQRWSSYLDSIGIKNKVVTIDNKEIINDKESPDIIFYERENAQDMAVSDERYNNSIRFLLESINIEDDIQHKH